VVRLVGGAANPVGGPLPFGSYSVYNTIMKSVKHKKRGPPATGKTPITGVRLSTEVTARIDRWAKAQDITRVRGHPPVGGAWARISEGLMSVRKRTWKTKTGETKEAWVVNYRDKAKGGARVQRTFHLKKEADAFVVDMKGEVRDGIHIARSKSVTVGRRGQGVDQDRRGERPGTRHRRELPGRGHLPHRAVHRPREALRPDGADGARVRGQAARGGPVAVDGEAGARSFLSMLLSDAMERGLATRNVARGLSSNRKRGKERKAERRAKGRLKVGVDIPTLDEARAVMANLKGRWRPLILTAMFCGLRSSELRGLTWANVDLEKREIKVTQRGRQVQRDRQPEVGGRAPHRPDAAAGGERAQGVEAPVPQGPPRPRLPEPQG